MKRLSLLLLLILPILACEDYATVDHTHDHAHPLIDHEHDVPPHDHLNPLGLSSTYITRVDPPIEVPGFPPFGYLKSHNHDYKGLVTIKFSDPPWNLTLTNIDYPYEKSTPVTGWGVRRGNYLNVVTAYTDCSDPEHTGYIAFRLDWDDGSARFYYQCPEVEEE